MWLNHKRSSNWFCLGGEGWHLRRQMSSSWTYPHIPRGNWICREPSKVQYRWSPQSLSYKGSEKIPSMFQWKSWWSQVDLTYLVRNNEVLSHTQERKCRLHSHCSITPKDGATRGDWSMWHTRFEVFSEDTREDTDRIFQSSTENHLPLTSSSHRLLTLSQLLIPSETRTWFIPPVAFLFMCSMIKRIIIQKGILQRQKLRVILLT